MENQPGVPPSDYPPPYQQLSQPQTLVIYESQQNDSTTSYYKKKVAKLLGIAQILIAVACIFLQAFSFTTKIGVATLLIPGFWCSIFVSKIGI